MLFSDAFVEGRIVLGGVRVLPLSWLREEILGARRVHDLLSVKTAVNALGAAPGCYPSVTPRRSR